MVPRDETVAWSAKRFSGSKPNSRPVVQATRLGCWGWRAAPGKRIGDGEACCLPDSQTSVERKSPAHLAGRVWLLWYIPDDRLSLRYVVFPPETPVHLE